VVGVGGIIRPSSGIPLASFALGFDYKTNMEVEILAFETSLNLCLRKGLHTVQTESDSLALVQLINGRKPITWRLSPLIHKLCFKLSLGQFQIIHIFREANMVLDKLAEMASSNPGLTLHFDDDIPDSIYGVVQLDYMRIPNFRFHRT
ncbi:hypothetical protein ACH5RR_040945, partial [Cinchona calisaya]